MPTTTRHNIYGVPDELWLQASIEALRRGLRVGELITQCLEHCLDSELIDIITDPDIDDREAQS